MRGQHRLATIAFVFRISEARDRVGDDPIARDQVPRTVSSASAPERSGRLCICSWSVPRTSVCAPHSAISRAEPPVPRAALLVAGRGQRTASRAPSGLQPRGGKRRPRFGQRHRRNAKAAARDGAVALSAQAWSSSASTTVAMTLAPAPGNLGMRAGMGTACQRAMWHSLTPRHPRAGAFL